MEMITAHPEFWIIMWLLIGAINFFPLSDTVEKHFEDEFYKPFDFMDKCIITWCTGVLIILWPFVFIQPDIRSHWIDEVFTYFKMDLVSHLVWFIVFFSGIGIGWHFVMIMRLLGGSL